MMQQKGPKEEIADLRKRAEKRLREIYPSPEAVSNLTREEVEKLVHELQVHQIELEMQNDELRKAQPGTGRIQRQVSGFI